MSSLGSKWKNGLTANNSEAERAEREKKLQKQKAEADRLIALIPTAISQAVAQGRNEIPVLNNRCLNFTDVACGDVDAFVDSVSDRPVHAENLAGVALIVRNWCEQNDLVCFVKGLGKLSHGEYEYTLIAKPK